MNDKLLNNRYQIKNIIGTGGMAIVYDGFDTLLSREVAIKILKDSLVEKDSFISRLKSEAKNSASLSDENIVSIYDVGHTTINGKNVEYIVMEKVEGQTLKDVIMNEAPLSNERIVKYASQIAKALQTAHMNGLVHRDIKPANILITKNDKVKVVDFGIARVTSDATLTYTSSILGTVHYISPEQAKGKSIDSRSDLYSLGVLLFEMATGKVPFDGESPVGIAVKHIQEKPEQVYKLNPKISEDLSVLISKLLKKEPEDRYKTASHLFTDLEKISKGITLDSTLKLKVLENERNTKPINEVRYKSKENIDINDNHSKGNKFIKILIIAVILGLSLFAIYYVTDSMVSKQLDSDEIVMPSVIDINEESAIKMLQERGLLVTIKNREYNQQIIEGNVISQSVSPQKKIKKGAVIELTISKGSELVTVPNIVGFDINNIQKLLADYGLEISEKTYEESDAKKDLIIKQLPQAGEKVKKGSQINLVISSGQPDKKVVVPNVENQDQAVAISTINSSGLVLGKITKKHSDAVKKNAVISQSLNPGKEVKSGTVIDIEISIGEETKNDSNAEKENNKSNQNDNSQNRPQSPSQSEKKKYVFKISVPSGDEKTFNLKIYNLNRNRELVYNQNIEKSKADEKGKITISIIDTIGSKFEAEFDGKKAEIN